MENDFNKLRGGYYTPLLVSEFITKWCINDANSYILEPSCGDGRFIYSASLRYKELGADKKKIKDRILGIELYGSEAKKAKEYGGTILAGDFFETYEKIIKDKKRFNAVVGNPPFIRYQNFDEKYRTKAFELVSEVGINLTKLSNIWLPFLILSCECLDEKTGRLGMIIPAELFQVDYAADARKYLSDRFDRLRIITFKKLLFDDAQQEVVILLGECSSNVKGIEVIEVESADDLKDLDLENNVREVKEIDHSVDKWTKYFLTNEELTVYRKVEAMSKLSKSTDLFEINVGVVSGQNKFFIVDKETAKSNKIENSVIPIIGRAEQVKGLVLTDDELKELSQTKKMFLFSPNEEKLSSGDKHYIKKGEKEKYHEGYKCKIRKKWYEVPLSWKPDAFMLRQINRYPKLVFNQTDATNTDTLHKIRFRDGVDGQKVTAAFMNSFTLAQCEITGRSYGGGVMTFEPGEVRRLKIPMLNSEKLDLNRMDRLMRNKDIDSILEYSDEVLLKDGLGLTEKEITILNGIWKKMSDRRLNRKVGLKNNK